MLAARPVDILQFLRAREEEGVATVMVTLTGIEGSSPRAIGTQMAVAQDGRFLGSLSGGCIEAAIVAEAQDALAAGAARRVRFGAGSPYLDIRLPCGSGIDLLFNPRPEPGAIVAALARLERREAAALAFSDGGVRVVDRAASGWRGDSFVAAYAPVLRIVPVGQGEDLAALARLARAFGADTTVLSPDRRVAAGLRAEGIDVVDLVAPTRLPAVRTDGWTAIVSLFHDRDWEAGLLPRLLALPAFFHGAVGSRRTQETRRQALRAAGVPDSLLRRLRGPVGLIPATRDPATLALSILSEVVEHHRRIGEEEGAGATAERQPIPLSMP